MAPGTGDRHNVAGQNRSTGQTDPGRGPAPRNVSQPRPADARDQRSDKFRPPAQEPKLFKQEGSTEPSPAVTRKEDETIDTMKKLTLGSLTLEDNLALAIARRPGYATHQTPINLRANHFPLLAKPVHVIIYKYDVSIPPEIKIMRMKRRIFEILFTEGHLGQFSGPFASNFENMVLTRKKLHNDAVTSKVFPITYYNAGEKKPSTSGEGSKTIQVRLTFDCELEIDKLLEHIQSTGKAAISFEREKEVLQGLNAVLVINANQNREIISAGRNSRFYPKNADCSNLGRGIIAIKGCYASIHTATARLLANINVRTAAFYDPTNLRALMLTYGKTDLRALEWFITGLRVETRYMKDEKGEPLKKERSISGFSRVPENGTPDIVSFEVQDQAGQRRSFTVAEWFKREHSHTAMLDVPVVNLGNEKRPLWTPAELCFVIAGQAYRRKLSPEQTSAMTKYGAAPPADNARRIIGMLSKVFGFTGNPGNLEAFGFELDPKMVTVPGHLLQPPKVTLCAGTGQESPVNVNRGSWNMAGKRFSTPANVSHWSYLILENRNASYAEPIKKINKELIKEFQTTLRSCGVSGIQAVDPINGGFKAILGPRENEKANDDVLEGMLRQVAAKSVKMLLVFLPSNDAYIYSRIKRWSDLHYGIHTVCCLASKLKVGAANSARHRTQFFANLAMKINLKAGGANQMLRGNASNSLLNQETMFVGIDVTHPSPGSLLGAPSIAGVVANVDKNLSQWPASISLQETDKREMVESLKTMLQQRLHAYSKHNRGKLPDNIVVYRDGVSDSQYLGVLGEELPQMKDACRELYPANGPQPRMTIIIVGKRHNTRFYPIHDRHADRLGNPLNGTLVDRAVTLHRGWDFYLQAHACIIGTARPSHYVVIHNEIKEFEAVNALHTLTHDLCYLFGRSSSAVSVCPPAYYADLVCERGRNYLYKIYNAELKDQVRKVKFNRNTMEWDWKLGVHENLADSMWYI